MPQMLRIPLTGGDPDPRLSGASKTAKPATPVNMPHYAKATAPEEFQGGPFVMPSDVIKKTFIEDTRTINPVTGQPYKTKGPKSAYANPAVLKTIIAHAKAKGVDPLQALAISQQEDEFGNIGDVGQVLNYTPDDNLFTNLDRGANTLAKALKDKLEYAKKLGYDKKGLDYALQAYNGYGKTSNPDFSYGLPISKENPLDFSKNPAYGKVIVSLLENLKKNPDIQRMINDTPAYGSQTANQKVMLKVAQNK